MVPFNKPSLLVDAFDATSHFPNIQLLTCQGLPLNFRYSLQVILKGRHIEDTVYRFTVHLQTEICDSTSFAISFEITDIPDQCFYIDYDGRYICPKYAVHLKIIYMLCNRF